MSVFLLVEDSPAMQRLWPAVRDRGLQPLLESLQGRTPIPINLAVGRAAWNGLSELQYYNEPQRGLSEIFLHGGEEGGGYISATALQKSIQNLAQITAQHGGSASQHAHLVVVAASSTPQAAGGPSDSTWTSLATEAARLRILPHLILGQGADTPGLLMFFTTVVRLQGAAEDAAGFRDGAFGVRTSARAGAEGAGAGTPPSGGPSHAYPRHAVPDERRAGPSSSSYAPHHHHSLSPPQMGTSVSASRGAPARSRKTSMPEAPRPSIVSQLQHLHGLSKKRIYGAKPARRPFIRGEEQRGSGAASEPRGGPILREDEPLSAPASPTRARYAALPGAAESGSRESARGPARREHFKDAQVPRPMYNPPAATRARANTAETAAAYADRPEAELLTRDTTTSYVADLGAGNSPVFKAGSTSGYAPISPTGYAAGSSSSYASAASSSYAPMLSAPSYGATSYGAAMDPTAYGGPSTNSGYRTMSTSAGYGAVPPSADYGASTSSAGYGPAPAPSEQQPLPSWSSLNSAAPSASAASSVSAAPFGSASGSPGYGGAAYGSQHEYDATYAAWTPNTYTSAPPSPTQGYTYLPFGVTDPYAQAPMQPLTGPIAGSSTSRSSQQPALAQPRPSAPSSHPPPPDPNAR